MTGIRVQLPASIEPATRQSLHQGEKLAAVNREMKEMLDGGTGTISPVAYARMKARYDEILASAEEYMVTLQVSQDVTVASPEVTLKTMQKLQEAMVA